MQLRHIATRSGRLSSFLKGELKMSTGLMNKLKWGTAIRVNGNPEQTDFPVAPGDRITVTLPDAALAEIGKNFTFATWEKAGENHTTVRFCTSWATTEENVDALCDALKKVLG